MKPHKLDDKIEQLLKGQKKNIDYNYIYPNICPFCYQKVDHTDSSYKTCNNCNKSYNAANYFKVNKPFRVYPIKCVFCGGEPSITTNDGNCSQYCETCKKWYYAPNYY